MADEGYYEEPASAEEQLRIAQHFLLSSPPGQVHEVLRDVAKLVPSTVLTDSALRGALHAYHVRHLLPVEVPDADYKVSIWLIEDASNLSVYTDSLYVCARS